MSIQITCDWVEQEYDKWAKDITNPTRDEELERSQYIAQAFALHMLKKSSSNPGTTEEKNGA